MGNLSVGRIVLSILALVLFVQAPAHTSPPPDPRPNIIWIFVDDMSAHFSCYGEKLIQTPNVDRLAREGTKFTNTFVTCPVCSPCRSALITGMYQVSIGAHHHRSGRGKLKIHLPKNVELVPALFKKAGYFTCIGGPRGRGNALGKTDYNFEWDQSVYDSNDWAARKPGQPFFMQVQLPGGKYRHNRNWPNIAKRELGSLTNPDDVKLPAYYPRDPLILEDWAQYLDTVRYTDKQVGDILSRLKSEGILDQTIILFMTDHGLSHARGKQFLYDEGLHVPFVCRGPGIAPGQTRDDLAEHIDLAATSLGLAGISVPDWMQARDLFAKNYKSRTAVFAARDRCDETVDRIRSVRTKQYKYIRNYYPNRPALQPNRYKDNKPIIRKLRALHAAGKLTPLQTNLLFAPIRPKEELYALNADTFELKNLANDSRYSEVLAEMRTRLKNWESDINDHGRQPESAEMYDSDMAVYLQSSRGWRADEIRENIELMKRWAEQGK